jgi:hypothetical protein
MSITRNADNWVYTSGSVDSAVQFASGLFIRKAIWAPNAADNDLLIQNAAGDTICKTRAKVPTGANEDEIGRLRLEELEGFHRGFKVVTNDAGTLYIHLK